MRSLALAAALAGSTVGLLGVAQRADAAVVADYPSFSDVTGLQLNGDATQVDTHLQLTSGSPSGQIGSAFDTTRFNPQKSFQAQFQISIHDGYPADGMAFVVQSSPQGAGAISASAGGSLGYQGIAPSVAVEFDTFDNDEFAAEVDPIDDHVGITTNGDTSPYAQCADEGSPDAPCDTALPFGIYGSPVYAWVEYDGATKQLRVFLSQTSTKPDASLLAPVVPLDSLGNLAFAGFTAATGGETAFHDVLDWQLNGELPDNFFTFGKLKKNKRKGTAKLTVNVPGSGELTLSGNGLKPQRPAHRARGSSAAARVPVAAAGAVELLIKAKGNKKRKLKKKGKVKVKAAVTFTPTGGTAATQTKSVKLKRKLPT